MKYTERPDFQYDPDVFKKSDTQTALKIYAEATKKHSPNPRPKFFEVDNRIEEIDGLWHEQKSDRVKFNRTLDVYAINIFLKTEWRMMKTGMVPIKRDSFLIAHNHLIDLDYFPTRGDMVYWNGYRLMIYNVSIPGEGYWQQTNIWMGLQVDCLIPPEGDYLPLTPSQLKSPVPAELSSNPGAILPEL